MDIVVGIADGLLAAETFGRRVEREVIAVGTAAEASAVIESRPGTCLISGGSDLTTADLETLTRRASSTSQPIGFISGWGGPEAAMSCATKLAEYPWSAPPEALLWSAYGYGGLQGVRTSSVEVLSYDDPELLERLRTPRRFMGLRSHSSGVDAPLGSNVLCSIEGLEIAGDSSHFLPCGSGGPCLRCPEGPIAMPQRLSPNVIAADIVLWSVCWGVLAAGAVFDPARSLAQSFMNSRWVGALLSTYKGAMNSESLAPFALSLINQGASLGQVCLALNRIRCEHLSPDQAWILLGDPAVRLEPVAPAPTRLTIGQGRAVMLQPGVTRLTLSSDAGSIITARRADGLPLKSTELYVRQIPGVASAVVLYGAEEAVACDFTARAVHRPPAAYQILRSTWDSVPQLAFTLRFLKLLSTDSQQVEIPDADAVRSDLAERLDRCLSMPRSQLASLLSGPEDTLRAFAASEAESWRGMTKRLHSILVDYCSLIGGIPSQLYSRGSDLVGKTRCNFRCRYCGMPIECLDYEVLLTGLRRRALWCYRCTAVSDTSAEVEQAWLHGPESGPAGTEWSYALELSLPRARAWRHYQASLTITHVPWRLHTQSATVAWSVNAEERFSPPELSIRFPESTPPGIYFLIAAIVAHGDLWICRRPVAVCAPSTGSPGSGSCESRVSVTG
jgi:hypothetical protein